MNVAGVGGGAQVLKLDLGGGSRFSRVVGDLELVFGQGGRAHFFEPVVIGLYEGKIAMREEMVGRHDINQHERRNVVRVIDCHAMRDPCTAITTDERKSIESEIMH